MTALAGVELESLVSEPDALTTRPPPCACALMLCFRMPFPGGLKISSKMFIYLEFLFSFAKKVFRLPVQHSIVVK